MQKFGTRAGVGRGLGVGPQGGEEEGREILGDNRLLRPTQKWFFMVMMMANGLLTQPVLVPGCSKCFTCIPVPPLFIEIQI